MTAKESISENLFAFYKQIVEKKDIDSYSFAGLENVSPPDNSWPAYVLSNRPVEPSELREVSEKMKSGEFSPFWIREINEEDDFDVQASSLGIRKINEWKGMSLEKKEVFNIPFPMENLKFEKVESSEGIDDWVDFINSGTKKGRKIPNAAFRDLFMNEAYGFFQLRLEGKIISTILMYSFKGSVGLYLLVTLEEYRGKGLGKFITSRAIDFYIQNACTKFVLHSTKMGYPLQVKLGFQDVCDYGVYWLLGKI